MALHIQRVKFPLVVACAAMVFALSSLHVKAGTPPMAEAVRGAIESIAPETYPDYVWTFIRRGETVKIKGKGPDNIVAIFGLEVDGDEVPVLTLRSMKTTHANGGHTTCDGEGNCSSHGGMANANASAQGQAASAAKGGNAGGQGKGKGKGSK